ncbi:hypothetical protein TSUD_182470 [Trifolium subterraneum]|uniref:Uncharacterized protein n=1 Tax=Trifolium subterraneum TaxID=3900 RepID=A0A2Z6M1Y4_TRISU|nr:hypothetical protein TSUD_182470 [Trifolium subterraneum]
MCSIERGLLLLLPSDISALINHRVAPCSRSSSFREYHHVARDSWCAVGLSSVLHNDAYQQSNAMNRIFAVCSNESSDIVGRVAMLLWCIWQNRNDKLWNDNVQTPRQIERYVFDAWNDWYSVHKLQSNSESRTTEANLVR